MPDYTEMQSIIDYSKYPNAIDPNFFMPTNVLWLSTSLDDGFTLVMWSR
jgi:hypothetical protein